MTGPGSLVGALTLLSLAYAAKGSRPEVILGAKAKSGDSVRSKGEVGQLDEFWSKILAHDICILTH